MSQQPLIIAPQDVGATRLDELISSLHLVRPAEQAEVYWRYESELLE